MRTYEYKGFTPAGQVSRGLIEAFDLKEAREKLATQGVLAEKVEPVGQKKVRKSFTREKLFTLEIRSALYREMESLLRAGLPLVNAMQVLIDAPEFGDNRKILAAVRDEVQSGSSFADALNNSSAKISPFEKAVIEVGERAGTLEQVLDRLADFLDEQQRLGEKVGTALIYPIIVLSLAVIIGIVSLGIMVPFVGGVLEQSGVELPLLTRSVLRLGDLVLWVGVPVLCVLSVLLVSLRQRARKDEVTRIRLDRRWFSLPFVRKAYTALVNLRFARTLALLLKGGVPLVEGMALAGRATGSPSVAQEVEAQAEEVSHGRSLAEAVRKIGPLSGSLPGWIQAGEASGNLSELLENAGDRFQQQWDRMVSRSLAMLEPLLIVIVGAFVLIISLAILLPVFSLNKMLM